MTTDGAYDKGQAPAANARADVQRVQEDLATTGAEKALTRLYDEADPTKGLKSISSPADRPTADAYKVEYTKQLTDANILPALSLAHVKQLGDTVKTEGAVDPAKVIARMQGESDPVRRALLNGFVGQYEALRREAPGGRITDTVLQAKLDKTAQEGKENVALRAKQGKDRGELGDLLKNPELFKAISGKADGATITKDDAEAFRKRLTEGTKPEDIAMRAKFAATPEADAQLRKTVDALIKSFDSADNQPDKKGATIKGGGMFQSRWDNFMTPDSLAKGMGFENPAKAKETLDKGVTTPNSKVEPVTNYDGTRLAPGKGPADLAARMLPDAEASKHFRDKAAADQARADLAHVFRKDGGILQDKGKPEVTAQNRDAVIAALKAREAERAKATGKPEDNTTSNWFANRYPKIEGAPQPAEAAVQPAADYKASKLGGQGSWGVTESVVKGQNLPKEARDALQGILNNKTVTGLDLRTAPAGTEVINAKNLEDVRKAVEAANNPQLKEWFNKRYPKK
jgi:hypothetical protein